MSPKRGLASPKSVPCSATKRARRSRKAFGASRSGSCRHRHLALRYDHPSDHIGDRSTDDRAGIDRQHHTDYADDGGVEAEIFGEPTAHPGELSIGDRSCEAWSAIQMMFFRHRNRKQDPADRVDKNAAE